MTAARRIILSWALLMHAVAAAESFTRTAEVRALPRSVAAERLPVEIRGRVTLTYPGRELRNIVIEDEGTGIFLHLGSADVFGPEGEALSTVSDSEIQVGTELQVSGFTTPGQYAPVIHADVVRILGKGELPPPREFVLSDVLTGSMDCQRIELQGLIQEADVDPGNPPSLRMELAVPTGRMLVECAYPGPWTRERLLGARVTLTAVAMTYFNLRGEKLAVRFQVGRAEDITIDKPPPADPFAVPLISRGALQPFSPDGPDLERVRIEGQVTLSRPGRYLYLEADGRAVRVNTRDLTRFSPGDLIVASGFIDLHQSFAELRGAEVRKLGSGVLPPPPLVTFGGLLSMQERNWARPASVDFNGRLIAIRGLLSSIEVTENHGRRFIITTDGDPITGILENGGESSDLVLPAVGSEVMVTGVCELSFPSTRMMTDFPNPNGFSLLLRSPADLTVIRPAPWWTAQRLWMLLGGVAGLLGMVIVWNLLLRRLVKQRSAQLITEARARDRAEIEFDATHRERTRLAADLHDTLEQALTGLSFQLDTSRMLSTKAPETSARHLELGRQLLTRSREDLRRSIWNLRARELEGHSLAEALRATALQAAEGRPVEIAVEELGEPHPLREFIAGNLLLLAQEAMTNAIKHGESGSVAVRIQYQQDYLVLYVQDDGRGFEPENARGLLEGHFGLQGMKERANRLDGELTIASQPGRGTRITVRVPLPAADRPQTSGQSPVMPAARC